MENVVRESRETEAIRQRMEEVRCDLDEDLGGIAGRAFGRRRAAVRPACARSGLILLSGVTLGLTCFPIALAALALLIVQVFETS